MCKVKKQLMCKVKKNSCATHDNNYHKLFKKLSGHGLAIHVTEIGFGVIQRFNNIVFGNFLCKIELNQYI